MVRLCTTTICNDNHLGRWRHQHNGWGQGWIVIDVAAAVVAGGAPIVVVATMLFAPPFFVSICHFFLCIP
jgi:hypothetical protein